ncbi:biotin attachment protein [Sedimentibacter hydroxybenzoicus DSM 7310]|uniref:Biotin attachment protein n=1 Tax=Sedimentibacter hydroxybenzoicus DSM 7310 TaxID=1123245 RepID=A0A974GUV6_SEDHY|nr:lipoyl domain-containing protein [Sedimentibacter hydroxybenzoicus]NYB72728.1 biotin attachment protein [Sedimentibacter hydroxybenzoicus DSM 7310]
MNVKLKHLSAPVVEEAYMVKWLKREGEYVKKGEPIATVETSKVFTDVKAPCEGILCILCEEYSHVNIHADIATIE